MLTEFTHLYNTLTRELDDVSTLLVIVIFQAYSHAKQLKTLATQASFRATHLQKPGGSAKTADDLNEPIKWVMSDLPQFKHILKEAEVALEKWQKEKATCILHLRELEGDMLKGESYRSSS